jgi:hypothetical protein
MSGQPAARQNTLYSMERGAAPPKPFAFARDEHLQQSTSMQVIETKKNRRYYTAVTR